MNDDAKKPSDFVPPTSDEPIGPAPLIDFPDVVDEVAGTTIGPYKLLQLLGKGGMGAVWLAEQREPVQRRVALKIIKSGLGGAQILARFEAERQALAMMDHPNIAKVLDAGATSAGGPYFVMELVKGIPFTKYCDQEKLTLRERLELFIPVCNAVQHAHQKGIIHRDLKPTNVLVALYDGKAIPKVIDFGVAKATTQKLTERTMYTEIGQLVGTLEYMAPEQAELNNLDIDTRADIYSLGVMLYELLTGALPFSERHLGGGGFLEMLRLIREVEPARPSTKLSSVADLPAVAALRKLEPSKLTHLMRGDLDWIVMKCLEKERSRRYETANQLGQELQRYLADEPVQAGPPSVRYRAGKFLRRNKGSVIAASVALLLVIAFLGLLVYTRLSTHATGLVDGLLSASIEETPARIRELGPVARWWADPLLRDAKSNADRDQDQGRQLRASLALLPTDVGQVAYLYERMLNAEPHEVPVIRDALADHKGELVQRLWRVVESSEKGMDQQRLRAAAALATYDPGNSKWDRTRVAVAKVLVAVNPVFLGHWREAFWPVKSRLAAPLADICQDPATARTPERTHATNLLAGYAADQLPILADVLMAADEKQFLVLYPKVAGHGQSARRILEAEIALKPPDHEEHKERLAKRQANAAAALLRMEHPQSVWRLFEHSADPRVRSHLIHRIGPLGIDVNVIVHRLDHEPNVTSRRALILSLGSFSPSAALTQKLQKAYQTDDDAGLHAAAAWLLRQWKHDAWLNQADKAWAENKRQRDERLDIIEAALRTDEQRLTPRWFVNSQQQTMVVIPDPGTFMMGSPPTDKKNRGNELHKRTIGRSFAIASKPVTVGEYRYSPIGKNHPFTETSPTLDCPVADIKWYEATAYCNWLSDQEGLSRCYKENANGKYDDGMTMLPDYLKKTGYRLPTEAEMEYATRAGSSTRRHYGDSDDLLDYYAWYQQNSGERSHPVGTKMPNDFGLYDVHGNVWCWCQEQYLPYPKGEDGPAVGYPEYDLSVKGSRVLRGGSFYHAASIIRSALRNDEPPSTRYMTMGFRVARTIMVE